MGNAQPLLERFNTQPPEGGWFIIRAVNVSRAGFNTQPPEGGWKINWANLSFAVMFQHTAARRRLGLRKHNVSAKIRFNTQPPEGGWPEPV